MGAWGVELFEDDVAVDVQLAFQQAVELGFSAGDVAKQVMEKFAAEQSDPDEGPVFYLALASLLKESGVSNHPVIDRAIHIVNEGLGLERWRDSDLFQEKCDVYQMIKAELEHIS